VQKLVIASLAGISILSLAQAADVTSAMLKNAATSTDSVLSFGLGSEGQRYSPLAQVNTKTVAKLVPAWSFSFGGEKQRGQESQPLIYKGKMFVTASYSRIFAIDLKTGAKLWKYEHRLPDGIMPCCDVVIRGAAL
jgi:alcohol dehydrogenase (cytochrome c)